MRFPILTLAALASASFFDDARPALESDPFPASEAAELDDELMDVAASWTSSCDPK